MDRTLNLTQGHTYIDTVILTFFVSSGTKYSGWLRVDPMILNICGMVDIIFVELRELGSDRLD
jgi:hypothetical protein